MITAGIPVRHRSRGRRLSKFTRNGFGKDLATGEDNYNKDITAARLSAEFTPNSDVFIRICGG